MADDTQPRMPLTRERILRAALRLADADGLEVLSMRRIARELGVQAMSLYNHVANKEEIVDGIVDTVVGEIGVPRTDGDWLEAMRSRARSAHEVLVRHRWATMALVSRITVGPAMLRYVDASIGCLHRAGFSYELADHALNALDNHIYGFTLQELHFPFEVPEYADQAREFLDRVPLDDYPYFGKLARLVVDGSYSGVNDFDFGLELILDGLDRMRGDRPKRGGNHEGDSQHEVGTT
ncbi:MAG: TetR/AcrR family transcriptional regulator [Spirochaetota bacterium]